MKNHNMTAKAAGTDPVAPVIPDPVADPNSLLLSQPGERFVYLMIEGRCVVLSAVDDLAVGEGTLFGGDYQDTDLALYAEGVTVSGTLHCKSLLMSAAALTTGAAGILSTDASDGAPPVPAINMSGDPLPPNAGADAVAVQLAILGAQDWPALNLRSCGGNGAIGQQGTDTTRAGDGGDAGAGGNLTVITRFVSTEALQALRAANSLGEDKRLAALSAFVTAYKDASPDMATLLAPLAALLPDDPDPDTLASTLETLAFALQQAAIQVTDRCRAALRASAGSYGIGGVGSPNGSNGLPAENGRVRLAVAPDAAGMDVLEPVDPMPISPPPPDDRFVWVHPAQCRMMLEKAKLMYLMADPVGAPTSVQDTARLLRRLQESAAPFAGIGPDSMLGQFLKKNETAIGAPGYLNAMQAIFTESSGLIAQLQTGKDLFGHDSEWVPLASYESYKQLLDALIDIFKALEDAYQQQFVELKKTQQSMDQIRAARGQADTFIAQARNELDQLRQLVQDTGGLIDAAQVGLATKKAMVLSLIEQNEAAINRALGADIKTLLGALSSCAMAAESAPNWMAQSAQFLYGAQTSVINDQGEPVNKDYVVQQFTKIDASVAGLQEGYGLLPDGTLSEDDPGGNKLVADQNAIETLISSFSTALGSLGTQLKTAFDDYVQSVMQRNTQVLNYNAGVQLMLHLDEQVGQAQAQKASLNDTALDTMQANWPELTAYVSKLYYNARGQILKTLDLTSRALNFWDLQFPQRPAIASVLGAVMPPNVDYTMLLGAKQALLTHYQAAIEAFGSPPGVFPAEPSQTGLTMALTADQLIALKRDNQVMLRIAPVCKATSAADSVFAGLANIRINLVRLWLDGATTQSGTLHTVLTHTGREQITDTHDHVLSFRHEPKQVIFKYNTETNAIMEDGVLTLFIEGSSAYAMVGPCAYWCLTVPEKYNEGLDLSKVTGGRLEFHGQNYSFA